MYKSGHSVILLFGTCCWTVGKQTSAVLLPQLQNFYYAAEKSLLFCSFSSRIFFIWEIFCYSGTLLLQWQNFSSEKYSAILLLCYPSGRIFLIWETFCYSATLLSHSSRIFHQSASAIVVKLCHQSFYDYLFGWGGGGGGTELTTGLLEFSLCQLPDVLLAGR